MKYRPFGKLDWQVSALGFGAMRLPVIDNDQSKIDEPEAIRMIRHAIDNGVNYIDTAFPYHTGNSELLVAKAVQDGYREKVKLATKMPSWLIKKAEDFDTYLNQQLEKLQTNCIEFYMAHGLNKDRWPAMQELGLMEWADKAKADGRIQYFGFSFHDDYDAFKEIIDGSGKWDFTQVQYNYVDTEFQAGTRGVKYAAENGVAVICMEPLRGGQITRVPPEDIANIWEDAPKQRSLADWALQWAWNQPEVAVVLSGMTTMQHVEENLVSAENSGVGILSEDELSIIERVALKYQDLNPIQCTDCNYCVPCPNNVSIPLVMRYYNEGHIYGDPRVSRFRYRQLPEEKQAISCDKCLECEEVCPQELPVSEWMEKIHAYLGPKKT